MDRYSLILENEKDNYKIWKVLDLQTNEISYEVRDYKTGEKKFTGLSLQECKNFLKIDLIAQISPAILHFNQAILVQMPQSSFESCLAYFEFTLNKLWTTGITIRHTSIVRLQEH